MTNSPVTDQGYSFNMTTDERGARRPSIFPSIAELFGGDGSDIGAFELVSPALGLGMNGNNIVRSWPAYYGDFTLQSAQSLTGAGNWLTVTDTPVEIGARFVVSNAIVPPSQFYRLSNQ